MDMPALVSATERAPDASMPSTAVATSPYLSAAIEIAAELVATAVSAPRGVTWHGDDLLGYDEASMRLVHGPVGYQLYGGAAGIGWFLGHLAATVNDGSVADTAIAALRYAVGEASASARVQELSLLSGATGVALACVDVGERLRCAELRRSGDALARTIAETMLERVHAIDETDLIGGLAGTMIGLLSIHRRRPDGTLLEACRVAAERLIERAHHDGFGMSWPDRRGGVPAPGLCGLGHGVSGIAWALAEIAWATGDRRVLEVAEAAFRYERGWFSADRCAWADLRQPPSQPDSDAWPAWTSAWCHGALGIGAVRLRVYEATPDVTALAEATAAIEAARALVGQAGAALRASHLADVTLCHGLGGGVELMLLAHEVTGLREHRQAARRAGDLCLSICAANGHRWTTGVRGGRNVPGLFLGLAGIGATMLRLHDVGLIGSPILPGRPAFAASRPN
jgi:lantibiotic modifying enzyme